MTHAESQPSLDADFGRIESSILPSLTMMLDALLDAAATARPGEDAAFVAAEIRSLAAELDSVTRQVSMLSSPALVQRATAA
ncbi:hypothetical protein E2493_05435 [Sphingomonas parva]|uniref:Histidine kinase n=1 Tax=Sphingomonas parva TaxID=2555898 RepID=A0A4Y8ZTP0_9SPHN|nr:hypothetical protein [Sphingomonas parva]TFI59284.1 hypothetical protein E2493_05435 [Sphingomonas parva]